MLIDTHSHIYLPEFDHDRDAMINRAKENDLKYILLPNIDSRSIKPMLEACRQYNGLCLPMMGLHPTSVKENYLEELENVDQWLKKENFYGIGETGIDLYWDKTYLHEQMDSFAHQIDLAKKHQLPVVIHVRESFKEVFEVLDTNMHSALKGIFHCFTGDLQQAEKVMSYGFKMGIGGVLTFKNSTLDEVVKHIDIEHLVLETDAPYLAPVPYRGKRNESAYISYTAKKLAEVKKMELSKVIEKTSANAIELFNLNINEAQ